MWPFRKRSAEAPSALTVDPYAGDPVARTVEEAAGRGEWQTIRDVLTGTADPDQRHWYLNFCSGPGPEPEYLERWIAAEPSATLPLLIRGSHAIDWAWEARGSGYANTVSDDGRRAFLKRLKLAENCLDEVSDRDPDDASSRALLVTCAMGRGLGYEEGERRFKETIARHRWHRAAHHTMLQISCDKWYGSHQQMHAFAEQTVTEMPAGSSLGELVPSAHLEHYLRVSGAEEKAYLADPGVLASLHRAAEKSVRHPARDRSRPQWQSTDAAFALMFQLCGDDRAAAAHFDVLGDVLTEHPWYYFRGSPGTVLERYRRKAYRGAGRA
jgi:hypothetical protein